MIAVSWNAILHSAVDDRRSKLPLLGPGAELLRVLDGYSSEELFAIAEEHGLAVAANASRTELMNRIVREKYRQSTDELYAEQDNCFLNVDEYLPFITGFIAKYNPRRISELGCGTGLLASWLAGVLPPDAVYLGSDFSEEGVLRARARMKSDPRFTFVTADAEVVPILENTDSILFPWVLNWLDTHAVERLWRRLAAVGGTPIMIACIHFRGCVERLPGVAADETREVAAAMQYLHGDRTAAATIWNTERYECYVRSLEEHFEIVEQNVQPGAHIFWACRSRTAS
jgi:SAM-dependent methyltransferase